MPPVAGAQEVDGSHEANGKADLSTEKSPPPKPAIPAENFDREKSEKATVAVSEAVRDSNAGLGALLDVLDDLENHKAEYENKLKRNL